jgi:hypothetical protein
VNADVEELVDVVKVVTEAEVRVDVAATLDNVDESVADDVDESVTGDVDESVANDMDESVKDDDR